MARKFTLPQQDNIIGQIHDKNIFIDGREIFLHSYIQGDLDEGYDPGVDYRMANQFLKNIRFLEVLNKEPIIIHLNSVGGGWDEGMIIYDAIINCQSHVTIVLWGAVMSMGSIIAQAADKRLCTQNMNFMVHEGSAYSYGTHKQTQSWAEFNKITVEKMIDIYAAKCQHGKFFTDKDYTEDQVKKFIKEKMMLKEDWILNAEEAKLYGFIDNIIGDKECESIDDIYEDEETP